MVDLHNCNMNITFSIFKGHLETAREMGDITSPSHSLLSHNSGNVNDIVRTLPLCTTAFCPATYHKLFLRFVTPVEADNKNYCHLGGSN